MSNFNMFGNRQCGIQDPPCRENPLSPVLDMLKGKDKCFRCGNLVQNPSFESESSWWQMSTVAFTDSGPFEGAVQARLGPGVAFLSQVVSLQGTGKTPLLFSFNALSNLSTDTEEYPGNLIAEITWLDNDYNAVGIGLRMFIPADRLSNVARITFFDQTDVPPANATRALVVFSKGQGLSESEDYIFIDGVVLAPMAHLDLIKNGGFEANLFNWVANPGNDAAFLSSYKESLVGAGHAHTEASGSLIQDIDISHLPPMTPFLFSFAARGIGPVALNVSVQWLDQNGTLIGSGLSLSIPADTLQNQGNYLSYLNITFPAVPSTAIARLTFSAVITAPEDVLMLDQVMFIPVLTTNLISNPSFEAGFAGWNQSLVNLIDSPDVYEGRFDAGFGESGGALWQDVELCPAEGHCYLFSTALGFRQSSDVAAFGAMIMQVIWLDCEDREIGLGLSLIASRGLSSVNIGSFLEWVPYIGITEPAPPGTAKARVLFSKTDSELGFIEIDNVTLARLI